MAIEVFNRQELKFIITIKQYEQLLAGIAPYVRPDKHNGNGRTTYRLYNLYIDTADHVLIRHSTSKPVTYKEKLRIRSYEDFAHNPIVFLEIKKRYKRITNKRRTKIPYNEALAFITSGTAPHQHSYMNHQVIRELESMLQAHNYQPKTFITYDRRAFSADDLRITFDTAITGRRYGGDETIRLLDNTHVVMELKSLHNIPLWLTHLLSANGVRKQSFSKYGREYAHYLQTHRAVSGAVHA